MSKDRQQLLNLSDENIVEVSRILDDLGVILIHIGQGSRVDDLSEIRLAAEHHDADAFTNLVLSNTLFGGSGALWEIWTEDKIMREEYQKLFCKFIDSLKKMGIKNARMNQVRSGLIHLK